MLSNYTKNLAQILVFFPPKEAPVPGRDLCGKGTFALKSYIYCGKPARDGRHGASIYPSVPKNAWHNDDGVDCRLEADIHAKNGTVLFDDLTTEQLEPPLSILFSEFDFAKTDGIIQLIKPTIVKGLFAIPSKGFKAGSEYRVRIWVKNTLKGGCNELRLAGTSLKEPLATDDGEWHEFVRRVKYEKEIATDFIVIGYGSDKSDVFIDDLSVREILK